MIRVFKIGNLEHRIIPTELAAKELARIVGEEYQDGRLDLVWGPDLEIVEYPETFWERFYLWLFQRKYK